MSITLAFLLTGATPASPAVGASRPIPVSSPAEWIGDADYPSQALREMRQGTTRVRLHVDRTGRATTCDIVESSGSEELDEATCRLLLERARFQPARRRGHSIEGVWTTAVRWQIPREEERPPEPIKEMETVGSFDLLADGSKANCTMQRLPAAPEEVSCDYFNLPVLPARDAEGKPVGRHVVLRSSVTLTPVQPSNGPTAGGPNSTPSAAPHAAPPAPPPN